MNTTRRDTIKSILAAAAVSAVPAVVASKLPLSEDCLFEDLRPDRYYDLQGGPYKDTGGWGYPYPGMGEMLVESLQYWDHCRVIDDRLAEVERRGFYLTVTTYFGSPYRKCGRIYLTERWLREFYRRHRDDTHDDWQRRYDEHYNALRASGWKVEYDRMSREELVALGWKGVDTYRKDG